jgi:polyribonucleotide nucleotidyltransferase
MRYSKQDANYKKAVESMIILEENDIKYTEHNNVASIVNPVNEAIISRSLIKEKTRYDGKWVDNIPLRLICKWYNIDCDIIDEIHGVSHVAPAGGCGISLTGR